MTDDAKRHGRETAPPLSDDDRALLRPSIARLLGALLTWGRNDLPIPVVTDAEADDLIDWAWSRPDLRPQMVDALVELRGSQSAH